MENKGISQEDLKLIACLTMLADHIGAVFFPGSLFRVIGRISFPIYCYLLTEGVQHTGNRTRYGRRLLIGVLLSEFPFDLLFFGGWNWGKQSVMLTLLLGYLYCVAALQLPSLAHRILLLIPFAYLGELLHVDYGGWGIVLIAMFLLTKDAPRSRLQQTVWLLLISWMISRVTVMIGPIRLPLQLFAIMAMIPICLYGGRKQFGNVWVQRGFYLFYPVHLLVFYWLR